MNVTHLRKKDKEVKSQILIAIIEESFFNLKENSHYCKSNSIAEAPMKYFYWLILISRLTK